MAKVQKWEIELNGEKFSLVYTRKALSGKVSMEINGEKFILPRKEREEIFRLGDEQAILCVDRKGKASIRIKNGEVAELRG